MIEAVFRGEEPLTPDRFAWRQETAPPPLTPTLLCSDDESDFRTTLRMLDLGPTQVYSMRSPSLRSRHISTLLQYFTPETYCLSLSLRGAKQITQFGRQTTAGPREMVFYDSSHPFQGQITADGTGSFDGIVLQIPKAALPLPDGKLASLTSTRLPAHDGVGALFRRHLEELLRHASSYTAADATRLSAITVDLFTAVCAHHLDAAALPPETHQQVLQRRIHAFIQHNLGDPALGPETIAAAHQISARRLYQLFQDQGLTVASWIRRHRLERCRHDLADPALRPHPIHVIAARWGFASNAHFSRTFRAAYGISPADYRATCERAPVKS
ncbi:helix-turn-helix domain-containing protein [Streptosporangium sp. NPDC051022]|uniref:helix-turn-helix domain-containing protein n=1 Tax=Streptosporangium sp. NPDC051022 TaxID=3155752 RepID=UPI00343C86B6